eukprot:126837_1
MRNTFCAEDSLYPCFSVPGATTQGRCTHYPTANRWDYMCAGSVWGCDYRAFPHLKLNLTHQDEAVLITNPTPLTQGPCAAGNLDWTRGGYEHWGCGSGCGGGAYKTHWDCQCTFIADAKCPPTTALTTANLHPRLRPQTQSIPPQLIHPRLRPQ